MKAIRANADSSDPVCSRDPIAFISVFALVLWALVPGDVVWRRKDEIYEVMGELAGIVVEENGSPWLDSRQKCLGFACMYFQALALTDTKLRPKLTQIVRTWDPEWEY